MRTTRDAAEARAVEIAFEPLTASLGVEALHLDATAPIDAEQLAQLRAAWLRYGVLVLRDQRLDVEAQLRFAERFGSLQKVRTVDDVHPHPAVMMVTNVAIADAKAILPEGEMQFHSDQCYYENPAAATLLYALEVPAEGGDTLFADCRAAYDAMSASQRARCRGRKALFVYDYAGNPTRQGAADPDAPHYAHPVIRIHPETGRPSIFVNRLMSQRILDLPAQESEALLAELFALQERPELVYRHVWRPGDLVMWDNRCVLHGRTDFDPRERRMLRRVTIAGDRPR